VARADHLRRLTAHAPLRVGGIVALLTAAVAVAPAVAAEGAFTACSSPAQGECATLTVPLDRSGVQPGTVALSVSRVRTSGAARGAIIPLAGGPGQSVSGAREGLEDALRTAAAGRDIVFFDQRGTGKSGLLRCPVAARSSVNDGAAIRACADEIGPIRALYTTTQSALDIESVRVLAGVEKVTLYGVSYGTRVALEYARLFPANVEALILDSVVLPEGSDPFRRSSFAAVKPVLRALCARGACRGISANPAADLTRVLARMKGRPLVGTFVDSRGRTRRVGVSSGELFQFIVAGDFNPALRAALPGALRAAADGDDAPLLRAVVSARGLGTPGTDDEQDFSVALFLATTCEEEPVPWDRAATPDVREAQALSALALLPESDFAPFLRSVAAEGTIVDICRTWPAPPSVLAPPSPAFPDVPVLAIAGKEDVRTPTADAFAVSTRFPRGVYLEVPGVAHSVLSSDGSGCADRAIRQFLAGAPPTRCTPEPRVVANAPRAPRALSSLRPSRGVAGKAGRTLRAAGLTLDDAVLAVSAAAAGAPSNVRTLRAGGLRGGRLVATPNALDLIGFTYVPGVVVSGRVRRGQTVLTISGSAAAPGTITVEDDRVTGTLGGVKIDRPVQIIRG
jgi:pimeloyl-ACP methyl ester carboxylesterase